MLPPSIHSPDLSPSLLRDIYTGLGCTTNAPDIPPAKFAKPLGANWRPWHLQLKLSLSPQKVGLFAAAEVVVTQSGPGASVSAASGPSELHSAKTETGGLCATHLGGPAVVVNRLGRCHATRPRTSARQHCRSGKGGGGQPVSQGNSGGGAILVAGPLTPPPPPPPPTARTLLPVSVHVD